MTNQQMKTRMIYMALTLTLALTFYACGGSKVNTQASSTESRQPAPVSVSFNADSAYAFCQAQCAFGPRTMNSEAHEQCGQWIARKFQSYGLQVTEQRTTVKGFDGTPLLANNIIASYKPELADRILICAHWDSRPWADNDPDEANHSKPVMAANDGASGVAVMLELARLLAREAPPSSPEGDTHAGKPADKPNEASTGAADGAFGIDFICFDAEDWGDHGDGDSWCLGSQYWAANPHKPGYKARFGILLDMVGGQQARFYREYFSTKYANPVVDRVWRAAATAGYSGYFLQEENGAITDDHLPVNEIAKIPCIDIIPYYPYSDNSFGPTWHTVSDDMQHIDKNTLKAVGQTLVQVIWE